MSNDELETAEAAETRKRGRPTIAELEAREQALKDREEALSIAEREAELRAAEANADLRAAQLERLEAANGAGRSGSARSGGPRSAEVTQPVRRRRYTAGEMPNEFHIPEEQIPPGMSYQWNNHSVFGMTNPSTDSYMRMQGWEPVLAERHPHLVPPGTTGPIIVKGQILMERPVELTLEAQREEYDRAIGEVHAKERQLYGERPDTEGGRQLGIKKSVERGTPTKANYQYEAEGPTIEP